MNGHMDKRRIVLIRSQDRMGRSQTNPMECTVKIPPMALPPLQPGQQMKVTLLKAVIPFRCVPESTSVPINDLFSIHCSLPSNVMSTAEGGFSTQLATLSTLQQVLDGELAPTQTGGSTFSRGVIVYENVLAAETAINVWYRNGVDTIRFWFTTNSPTGDIPIMPPGNDKDWFLTLAFEVVDTEQSYRVQQLLASMNQTMQLQLLQQDRRDTDRNFF